MDRQMSRRDQATLAVSESGKKAQPGPTQQEGGSRKQGTQGALWELTWWASHPCGALAASISFGTGRPRQPPSPPEVWGVKNIRLLLTLTMALSPPPAPTIVF